MAVSSPSVVGMERNVIIKGVKLTALCKHTAMLYFSFNKYELYFTDHKNFFRWATVTKFVIYFE
jgi:hypothetical protein